MKVNTKGNSIYKVPDGKLIKISVEFDNNLINLKIKGDFFVHPEESVEQLEKELIGAEFDEEKLKIAIESFVTENNVELFGIDPASLAKAIIMCDEGSDVQ